MDLFELLFIAAFLLFPILEGVLRRRKGPGQGAPGESTRPGEAGQPGRPDRPQGEGMTEAEDEPASAAEMLPEDLWAVLTGERPASRPRPEPEPHRSEPEWEPEPQWKSEPAWQAEPDFEPDLEPDLEPVSLEYQGPEAYSLETLDHKAVSLEANVPTAEERHRRFHAIVDAEPPRRRTRKSPIGRALQRRDSLRQAFVLNEVLGTPKGLE